MKRNFFYLKSFSSLTIIYLLLIAPFMVSCGSSIGGSSREDDKGNAGSSPIAIITRPSGELTITEGQSVNFQGSVTQGNPPYAYSWDFNGGAINSDAEDPGDVTFNTAGTYTVTFTVTDSDEESDSDSVILTVNPSYVDTQPTAAIISPSGSITITEGQTVNFQGSVSSGNPPFTYLWDFHGGAAGSTVEDPGEVIFDVAGTYEVTFTVIDSDGDTDSASVTVMVNPKYIDTQPTAAIISPTGSITITEGQTVNFQGSVSSGNPPFTYLWDFHGGAMNSYAEDPGEVIFDIAGTYEVTFTVTDNDGDTDSASVTVTVNPKYVDTQPTAKIDSPTGSITITEGQTVNFQGSVSSGNPPFTYIWNFHGGAVGSDLEDPGDVIFDIVGIYEVTFTVRDSDGDMDSASMTVTVNLRKTYPYMVVDVISVGQSPINVAITPNGDYLYITNFIKGTVTVVRTSDNTVIDIITVGNYPQGVGVTPNGMFVYVANVFDGTVSVIRTSDNKVIDTIPVGNSPHSVAIKPNGNLVYVTNYSNGSVSVIRTSDNKVIDTISVGNNPQGVAVTPNGNYVYVANGADNTISVIRTSDNKIIDTISVGNNPQGVAVMPNGNFVYVTNFSSSYSGNGSVSVIRTSDNKVIDTIFAGNYPEGIAITPNGNLVYVTNGSDGKISVIQTSDNTLIDTIIVGTYPIGVAIAPNGNYVYVTNSFTDTVLVIGF